MSKSITEIERQRWKERTREREYKRKERLVSGDLIVALDKDGEPITLPRRKSKPKGKGGDEYSKQ